MNKESIMFGIIGLLAGVVITGLIAGQAVNNSNTGMMRMMGVDTERMQRGVDNHGEMSMAEMTRQLANLNGDDFDKAFIEMMIVHHEGAVDMARLIPARAKHEEIKRLGQEIISAQTGEIADMQQWQKDWGYGDSDMMQMMHGRN